MVLTRAFACATPGRRVGHSRLPGRRDDRDEPHRPARRPGVARAGAGRAARGRAAPPRDGRGRARARAGAVRVGRRSRDGSRHLRARHRAGARPERAFDPRRAEHRGGARRIVLALLGRRDRDALVARAGVGPRRATRSRSSSWKWVVAAIGLNLLSVIVARARVAHGRSTRRCRRRTRASGSIFSAFAIGLFANAVLPGRIGRARARRRADAPSAAAVAATRRRCSAPCSRTALFDVVPALLLVVYVLADGEDPALGADEHRDRAGDRGILLVVRADQRSPPPQAGRRRARPPCGGSLAMARVGLERVARAGGRPRPRSCSSALGWLLQLLAVWAAMRAFDIDEPLPAAGLVLVLMNVATIFPLWPGNVGLLQAAVALPLVPYGVAYAHGLRVRDRPSGDRGVGRRRRRARVPRAGGALVRDAQAHARRTPSRELPAS